MQRARCGNPRTPSKFKGVALWCCVCAVHCITGCGEGSNGGPGSPSPVQPPPRVLQQGSFALAAPDADFVRFALAPITESSGGLWEATVDWASGTNTLWMWVTNGVCTTEQFAKPECPFEAACQCEFAIRSEAATPKPRVLTIPNAPPATRTLIVANLGPLEEMVTYRVMLTPANLHSNAVSQVDVLGGSRSSVVATKKMSKW